MKRKWDVVIVGGGLAGYVAANYLAKTDLSILLLEKGKHVGGRARTNKVKQQYLNLGPHALYKRGKAMAILEELRIELQGKSPKLAGALIEDNQQYPAPLSPLGLFTTNLFNGKERLEWIAALAKIMRIDTGKLTEQTFQQWVRQTARSTKVQSLLYVLGRLATYCHAPEMVSAKIMLTNMKNAMGGVLYLDGGWQTIIDQLHNQAIIAGVEVKQHATVKQIEQNEKWPFKIQLANGEEILSNHVICTTSPDELNEMLGENQLPNFTPVRGATLDVALTQLPNPKQLFAMGITDPLYFSVHSPYARLSDDSTSAVLHVFKYHQPDQSLDATMIKTELEQFLEKLQPGWKEYKITSRFLPNIIVNQRLPQAGDEHMLQHAKEAIPGLYLAGDWASPDCILADAAISTGKQAAEEIILNEKRKKSADFERRIPAI